MPLGRSSKRLRRDFLWRRNKEGKGCNLVKWEVTQSSKGQGELGIRNLKTQNKESSLWKQAIIHKYGQTNHWCSNEENTTYGVGVWRAIRSLWPKLQENSRIRVGNGLKTRFWKDNWLGESPLQDRFPDLMMLCRNPEINVAECWSNHGWNLNFRRHLNEWAVERVASSLNEVEMFAGTTMEPDKLRWRHYRRKFLC
ncbi:hypothetical protein H5410_055794 [Solanum commersonii]|uniref:Uncharacterized protein n=1 Tax=Solanum commersonii TaxID=4109 RepID=A0A9J5WKE2_SOLCO|nr:hypothetical protein H5410_055794 [Solanum commersonii]